MNSRSFGAERASVDGRASESTVDTVGSIISDPRSPAARTARTPSSQRCLEQAVFRRIGHRFDYE